MSRNRTDTDCVCGFPGLDHVIELPLDTPMVTVGQLRDEHYPQWNRDDFCSSSYRSSFVFKVITCVFCRRIWTGWYKIVQSWVYDPDAGDYTNVYRLSDTSYYESFNDEPVYQADESHVREVSIGLLVRLLDEHHKVQTHCRLMDKAHSTMVEKYGTVAGHQEEMVELAKSWKEGKP